jgi:hypothetical protein
MTSLDDKIAYSNHAFTKNEVFLEACGVFDEKSYELMLDYGETYL